MTCGVINISRFEDADLVISSENTFHSPIGEDNMKWVVLSEEHNSRDIPVQIKDTSSDLVLDINSDIWSMMTNTKIQLNVKFSKLGECNHYTDKVFAITTDGEVYLFITPNADPDKIHNLNIKRITGKIKTIKQKDFVKYENLIGNWSS